MGRYIKWDHIANRYPSITVKDTGEVNSWFIVPAEFELDSLLSSHFATPFSSNNYTAIDLSTQLAYARLMERSKAELAKNVKENVLKTIEMLKNGAQQMITTSGDQLGSTGSTIYSTTKDYHPATGVGDIAVQHVSSAQVYDEEQDRG